MTRVPNNDITARLIARFKELLAQGTIRPGLRLPAERGLAKSFGVSRNSVRQALKVLEIMGVVDQRVGDGTYVNVNASAILGEPFEFLVLLDSISHHEIFEARLIVEPELAARAAERATMEDLAMLRQQLSAMEDRAATPKQITENDLAFHNAIFSAAGNRVCQKMFSMVHRLIALSIERTSTRVQVAHTLRFHRAIYSAIERRDVAGARRQMTEHLLDAREVMMRHTQERAARQDISPLITPLDENARSQQGPSSRRPAAD